MLPKGLHGDGIVVIYGGQAIGGGGRRAQCGRLRCDLRLFIVIGRGGIQVGCSMSTATGRRSTDAVVAGRCNGTNNNHVPKVQAMATTVVEGQGRPGSKNLRTVSGHGGGELSPATGVRPECLPDGHNVWALCVGMHTVIVVFVGVVVICRNATMGARGEVHVGKAEAE